MNDQSREFTLLYTASLSGQLELLPRLYTFIKTLRSELQPAWMLDLGQSCAADVWHCDETEGRSMLVALDGMGYTAANASHLTEGSLERLRPQLVMALVDAAHPHVEGSFLFSVAPQQGDGHLCVVMTPDSITTLNGDVLRLQSVVSGQIGVARLAPGSSGFMLLSSETRILPAGTAPDATIAGVVDFVVAEARYYGKRKSGQS